MPGTPGQPLTRGQGRQHRQGSPRPGTETARQRGKEGDAAVAVPTTNKESLSERREKDKPVPVLPGRLNSSPPARARRPPGPSATSGPRAYRRAAPRCGRGAGTSWAGWAAPWLSPSSERPARSRRHPPAAACPQPIAALAAPSPPRPPPPREAARMRGAELGAVAVSLSLLFSPKERGVEAVENGSFNVYLLQIKI